MSESKNLYQKLAEVVQAIDHVEKSGRNTYQNYNYVKAADVARAVRAELSLRNVYLVSDTIEIRNYEVPAKEGVMQAADIKMKFSFFNGDNLTEPAVVLHSYGTGTDKGDKAVYKAMTGALKYGLRNAFLIPDESDPENEQEDSSQYEQPARRTRPPQVNQAPAKTGGKKPGEGSTVKPPTNAQGASQTGEIKAEALGLPSAADLDAVAKEQEIAASTAESITSKLPEADKKPDTGPKPDKSAFDAYTARAVALKQPLEKAGLKPSKGLQTGAKLKNHLLASAGAKELADLTTTQWEAWLGVMENLAKTNPTKAVEVIEDNK